MRNARLALIVVGLAVLATGFVILRRAPSASADDANHVTGLALGTFDFDGTTESSVNATFSSTDSQDERLVAELYLTPVGGSEALDSRGETSRNGVTGAISLTTAVNETPLSSGDQIRAVFTAYDSGGGSTFTYQRTWTKP